MTSLTTQPGGKVYTARVRGRELRIVKQNTAAGGPRWKAYLTTEVSGVTRIVAKGDYLADVKRDALLALDGGAPTTNSSWARPWAR